MQRQVNDLQLALSIGEQKEQIDELRASAHSLIESRQESNVVRERELRAGISELQQKLSSQQMQREEEMFEAKRIQRQLTEDNKNLSLQVQQLQNSQNQIELRLKKELQTSLEIMERKLIESEDKVKEVKQKYKGKNKVLRQKVQEWKERTEQLQADFEERDIIWMNEKIQIQEQVKQTQIMMEAELQQKENELASVLQTGLNNLEEQKIQIRNELNEKYDRQTRNVKNQLEQDLQLLQKREGEARRKLEEQLQTARSQNNSSAGSIQERTEFIFIKQENEKLKSEISSLKVEQQVLISQNQHQSQSLQSRNEILEEQMISLKKQIGKLEMENEKQKKQSETYKHDFENIKDKLATLQREKDQLTLEKRSSTKKIEEYEKQKTELFVKFEQKKEENNQLCNINERFQERLSNLEREKDELKKEKEQLQLQVMEFISGSKVERVQNERERDILSNQIEQLTQQKNEMREELGSVREENKILNEKIQQQQEQICNFNIDHNQQQNQLENELQRTQEQFEQIKQELEKVQEQANEGMIRYEVIVRQNNIQQDQINQLQQFIQDKDSQLNYHQQRNSHFVNQFNKCKHTLKNTFLSILSSINSEQNGLRREFESNLRIIREEVDETIAIILRRYKEYYEDLMSSTNSDKEILLEQIAVLKAKVNENGRRGSLRQQKEKQNEQFQSEELEKTREQLRGMNQELMELKLKERERDNIERELNSLKLERQRESERLRKSELEVERLEEQSREKVYKINGFKKQEMIVLQIEMQRVKDLCQQELNIANEKVSQMQKRLDIMTELYQKQIQNLHTQCLLASSRK